MSTRQMPIVILIVCAFTAACFATTTEVYFTHPYGGIHKIDASGTVTAVLPNIGRCTGLESDGQGNLFFGRFTQDLHEIDLMMMTPQGQVTNLGNIVQLGPVELRWHGDITVVPEPVGISLLALGGLALLKTRRFH